MNIFISSRIRELQMERKTAVDSIHLAGHDPVYIEAEPIVKDKRAKTTMDLMLQRSAALVCVCYLSLGKKEPILGRRTPVEYEISTFRRMHPEGPIFIFTKDVDRYIQKDPSLEDWIQSQKSKGVKITQFEASVNLSEGIVKCLQDFPPGKTVPSYSRKAIHYEGPDYVGLIEIISETLFSEFGTNLDYISQGARAGLATVLFGCSFRDKTPANSRTIQRKLRQAVLEDIRRETESQKLLASRMNSYKVRIRVEEDDSWRPSAEFFVQIRTIDTPGQLNAVCKVLKKLRFNIDDVTLRPAEVEYPRQTLVTLWISSAEEREEPTPILALARLEWAVRDIIGVRSFSIRRV